MKRSDINFLVRSAQACFEANGWILPPNPRWDVTDFGLGDWSSHGLVLVNLTEEPEYCEKLMYASKGMVTPLHKHKIKKEDIVCRWGRLSVRVCLDPVQPGPDPDVSLKINGRAMSLEQGTIVILTAGERVTLEPGVLHEFWAESEECIIGEVSTANDDANDNVFVNADVGRFPEIDEDEPPIVRLVSEG